MRNCLRGKSKDVEWQDARKKAIQAQLANEIRRRMLKGRFETGV